MWMITSLTTSAIQKPRERIFLKEILFSLSKYKGVEVSAREKKDCMNMHGRSNYASSSDSNKCTSNWKKICKNGIANGLIFFSNQCHCVSTSLSLSAGRASLAHLCC